jgi:hypothetical protein
MDIKKFDKKHAALTAKRDKALAKAIADRDSEQRRISAACDEACQAINEKFLTELNSFLDDGPSNPPGDQ